MRNPATAYLFVSSLLFRCHHDRAYAFSPSRKTSSSSSTIKQTRQEKLSKIDKPSKGTPVVSSKRYSINGDSSESPMGDFGLTVHFFMVTSLISWFAVSWEALMTPHPNPVVAATLCLRHDIFTTSQALAFQFPVITAAFLALKQNNNQDEILHRRILLGIASMSLWTGAGVFWCKTFSRGYDLFANPTRYAIATAQSSTALWALLTWKQSLPGLSIGFYISRLIRGTVGSVVSLFQSNGLISVDDPERELENDCALYSVSALGLLVLAIMPQLVGFPTATIPTILGKRFSRTASGITFLGAVLVYCLRDYFVQSCRSSQSSDGKIPEAISTLRRGLAVGSIGHLFLVVGKIIGIDGGGLIFSGNGLWEFYPSMVNASRAATSLMIVTFSTLAFVCTRKNKST